MEQALIIIEGPDGSGKSRLAAQLADDLGLPIHERASSSVGGPVPRLWEWTVHDVASWDAQPLSIYDRHPLISEYIYGPIARGEMKPGFTHPSAKGMIHRMAQQALVIFCSTDLYRVRQNVLDPSLPQMEGVVSQIDAIWAAYRAAQSNWQGWSVTYDYMVPAGKNSYEAARRSARLHIASFRRTT